MMRQQTDDPKVKDMTLEKRMNYALDSIDPAHIRGAFRHVDAMCAIYETALDEEMTGEMADAIAAKLTNHRKAFRPSLILVDGPAPAPPAAATGNA